MSANTATPRQSAPRRRKTPTPRVPAPPTFDAVVVADENVEALSPDDKAALVRQFEDGIRFLSGVEIDPDTARSLQQIADPATARVLQQIAEVQSPVEQRPALDRRTPAEWLSAIQTQVERALEAVHESQDGARDYRAALIKIAAGATDAAIAFDRWQASTEAA